MAVQTPIPPSVAPPIEPVPSLERETKEQGPSVELASWSRRFTAWLVDWIILFGVATAIAMAIAVPLGDTSGDGAAILAVAVLIPGAFMYFSLLNGSGKTLGKRLQGITVVDAQTLRPIGGWRGALRELVRAVLAPYFAFLIDGLWPLWDKRKQALHDKAARSVVIRDPHEPVLMTPSESQNKSR
jgi:uncharacterized RDD family membrane protein YckC